MGRLPLARWKLDLNIEPSIQETILDNLSHLVIPPSQLIFEKDAGIGTGGYGEVYLAVLTGPSNTPPKKVAVKKLRIVQAKETRRRTAIFKFQRLVRELTVWSTAEHPNILELVGFYLSEDYECAQLVPAYMVHGNVRDYIKTWQPSVVTRLNFVEAITLGINYLHNCHPSICHGDLKPSNVLVNDDIEAVLCDFGLATFIEESGLPSGLTTSNTIKGSTRYMSPELLQDNDAKNTLESDMWAWGCTTFENSAKRPSLFQGLTDLEPYHTAMRDVNVMMAMVLGKCPGSVELLSDLTPDTDTTCHRILDSLKQIIAECWVFNSAERPSSTEIIDRLSPSDAEISGGPSPVDWSSPIGSMGEDDWLSTEPEHEGYQDGGHSSPTIEASFSSS
ncbi:hypothetical protein FRC01_007655 [Tulasnella sp. 417]|nr:hypothetical protein FRC01_007655 [Tulasnella sp. 417]